jgi:YHS domain-containing protein
MTANLRALILTLWCVLSLSCIPATAKEPEIYTALFSKTAIGGFDAVAYFTEHKPIKGDPKYLATYRGAEWRFYNAANRDRFVANPEQFAPQYGGYCAWAVAQGYTASGDPQLWKIVDNKLYLNYDADVQKKWEANIPDFIRAADKNWPTALGK